MGEGNRFVGHTVDDVTRLASAVGPRGMYHLFIWGGGLMLGILALRALPDLLLPGVTFAFSVAFSWMGRPGGYQTLTQSVGATAALCIFLLPFVAYVAQAWFRRYRPVMPDRIQPIRRRPFKWRRAPFRLKASLAVLACALACWSAQVPAQTSLALDHPGARLDGTAKCPKQAWPDTVPCRRS